MRVVSATPSSRTEQPFTSLSKRSEAAVPEPISRTVAAEESDESDNEWDVTEEEGTDKTAAVDDAIAALLVQQAQTSKAYPPVEAVEPPPEKPALSAAAAVAAPSSREALAPASASAAAPGPATSALAPAVPKWEGPQFPCEWLYETPEPWDDNTLKKTRAKAQSKAANAEAAAITSKLDAFLASVDPNDEATVLLRSALAANPESGIASSSSSIVSSSSIASSSNGSNGGGGGIRTKGRKGSSSSSSADKDEDGYEATPAASRALLRFQAVLRKEPNQGLRYEWGGVPLWASTQPPPQSSKVPPCPSCGAPRRFECQLMPALLFALHVDECAATAAAAAAAARDAESSSTQPLGKSAGNICGSNGAHASEALSAASLPPPPPLTGLSAGEGRKTADASAAEAASADEAAAELRALAGTSVLAQSTVLGMDWSSVAVYSCESSCSDGDEEHIAVEPPVN